MLSIQDFTPGEIERFEAIRKMVTEYNTEMSKNQRPTIPFISIDERIRCKQYLDIVDREAAARI